jgi:acetate kinase
LVFTAGIGENAPAVRRMVIDRMSCFGIELAETENAKSALRISGENSRVGCYVVPTDEELMIARHTLKVSRKHGMPEEKRA